MLGPDLIGNIATGLITASATCLVCVINNGYNLKRDREARDEAHKEQLDQIRQDYSDQLDELKTDFYSKFQELQSTITTFISDSKHQYDLIKMEIKILSEKQDKYNHLQERTYELEKLTEVQDEKLKHLEKSIGGA